MSQLALDIPSPASNPVPARRIDTTIERLDQIVSEMSDDEQVKLGGASWWAAVVIVARLRAMERAEATISNVAANTMADAYDRVAIPGEHAVEAIIRTFKEVYGS